MKNNVAVNDARQSLEIMRILTSLYISFFSKNTHKKENGLERKKRKTPQKFIPEALLKLYRMLPSPLKTSFKFISKGIPCCFKSHHAADNSPNG
jgi:hypothetical protein